MPAYIGATTDGCMMGLPPKLLIPLLVNDLALNIMLTLLFVCFLLRLLRFRGGFAIDRCPACRLSLKICTLGAYHASKDALDVRTSPVVQMANTSPFTLQLESLIKRSMAGACLLLIPTVINLSVLLHFDGIEEGWACFSGCTLDTTWTICVVHWLTNDPSETEPASVISRSRPEIPRSYTSGTQSSDSSGTKLLPREK